MAQQIIDVGVNADDGLGDSLYQAGNKINTNFTELFELASIDADIKFFGNNIVSRLSCSTNSKTVSIPIFTSRYSSALMSSHTTSVNSA